MFLMSYLTFIVPKLKINRLIADIHKVFDITEFFP